MQGSSQSRRTAHVVAATDGTAAGARAVRFGAEEAVRRDQHLEVVHVMPVAQTAALSSLRTVDDSLDRVAEQRAREVLAQAVAAARQHRAGLQVVPTLVVGPRVGSLVQSLEDADLVVVAARDHGVPDHVWTGATVAGVAARAQCPVVVVPHRADIDRTARFGRVTVALKEPGKQEALLGCAFASAEQAGAELLVLHAWRMPSGYDDVVSNAADRAAWGEELGAGIEGLLVGHREQHPGVEVHVGVVHGQTAHHLVLASRACDRMLISKPAHLGYFHHLGATARALLREAECPVEVFPHDHDAGRDGQ